MNNGETRHSRPSDPASPRRDLQKHTQTRARALAQARSFRLSEISSRSGERSLPKMNNGETRHSRPSDPASPRRDLQKHTQTRARALAQARSFRLSEISSRSGERSLPK
ncbi:hypothetical protein DEO72_LG8g2190 [Vigna unguiculata]|uniref:Uncharacterized protein n=1 Tax=Vigna unguiculata TaxID=3917 RepID=A0A4D6MW80_VIGUN|nr:hypothetical protein DEO72_LG8g2190 [Vigna unguiculata]